MRICTFVRTTHKHVLMDFNHIAAINECENTTLCKNNATCENLVEGYKCHCQPTTGNYSYNGTNCERKICLVNRWIGFMEERTIAFQAVPFTEWMSSVQRRTQRPAEEDLSPQMSHNFSHRRDIRIQGEDNQRGNEILQQSSWQINNATLLGTKLSFGLWSAQWTEKRSGAEWVILCIISLVQHPLQEAVILSRCCIRVMWCFRFTKVGQKCVWIIKTDPGYSVLLNFTGLFKLGYACWNDPTVILYSLNSEGETQFRGRESCRFSFLMTIIVATVQWPDASVWKRKDFKNTDFAQKNRRCCKKTLVLKFVNRWRVDMEELHAHSLRGIVCRAAGNNLHPRGQVPRLQIHPTTWIHGQLFQRSVYPAHILPHCFFTGEIQLEFLAANCIFKPWY